MATSLNLPPSSRREPSTNRSASESEGSPFDNKLSDMVMGWTLARLDVPSRRPLRTWGSTLIGPSGWTGRRAQALRLYKDPAWNPGTHLHATDGAASDLVE